MSMGTRLTVPITRARARLFKLADVVSEAPDTVVVLERRGSREAVALVRETRLAYLEARVQALERLRPTVSAVAGSLRSDLADDELERALRKIAEAQTARSARRTRPLVR
jgi:hypothetical protein